MNDAQAVSARQERRKERTRQAILDAMVALISRRGFAEITIAELAAEADVGVGSFYNHFQTKEQVLQEATQARFAEVNAHIEARVGDEVDVPTRVAVGVLVSLAELEPNLMWAAFLARGDGERPVISSPLIARLVGELDAGADAGLFEVPAALGAVLVVGAVNSSLTVRSAGWLAADSDPVIARAVLRELGLTPAAARRAVERAVARLDRTRD